MEEVNQNKPYSRERRALQAYTVLVALIPLTLGTDIALLGMQGLTVRFVHAYGGPIVPELDSTLRFLAVQFIGSGLILLWAVPRIEERTIPFRIVALAFLFGALARLISRIAVGKPYPFISIVNFLEAFNGIILLAWQWRIARRQAAHNPKSGASGQ